MCLKLNADCFFITFIHHRGSTLYNNIKNKKRIYAGVFCVSPRIHTILNVQKYAYIN